MTHLSPEVAAMILKGSGQTLAQLGKLLGVDQSEVSRWKRLDRRMPLPAIILLEKYMAEGVIVVKAVDSS